MLINSCKAKNNVCEIQLGRERQRALPLKVEYWKKI